jgi:mucin-like protein
MKSRLVTLATVLFTLALVAGVAQAGETPWFDRDKPSGVGEYETTRDLLKIECRFADTKAAITEGSPVGYHCNAPEGGWCKNNDPAGLKCRDMEVRYKW